MNAVPPPRQPRWRPPTQEQSLSSLIHTPLHSSDWEPRSIDDLPALDPMESSDHALVFLLQAPLLKWKLGDVLSQLNMTHGAIGVQTFSRTNQSNNLFFSVEYDGIPEMFSSVFPTIVNGTTLQWHNFGGSMLYFPVNVTYYSTGVTLLGQLSAAQYNRFVNEYIANINATRPYYQMMSVVDAASGEEYLPSFDCFDLVYDALDWLLHEVHMKLDPDVQVWKCWTNLITGQEPMRIDDVDEYYEDILQFYQLIEFKFKDLSLLDALVQLRDLVIEKYMYLRVKNSYYKLKLAAPYGELRYEQVPIHRLVEWYRAKKANAVKWGNVNKEQR